MDVQVPRCGLIARVEPLGCGGWTDEINEMFTTRGLTMTTTTLPRGMFKVETFEDGRWMFSFCEIGQRIGPEYNRAYDAYEALLRTGPRGIQLTWDGCGEVRAIHQHLN